jgi:D-proline reductase (dithiol) PrdB
MYPVGFKIGNSLGKPGMKDLQKQVLKDALLMLSAPAHPGEVLEREYHEYHR